MLLPTVAIAVLAIGVWATPAAAHEGPGTFAVETAELASDSEVRYVVRLTYIGDGDPASDSTVTATAIAPDGTAQTPVPMAAVDQDGRYGATVSFPSAGEWTVRFTSILPPATLDRPQVIEQTTTTADRETTTSVAADDDPTDASADTTDDDDGLPWPVIGLVAAGVVIAGLGVAVVRRRRSSAPPTSG
jgi:hypothetical protein